MSHTSGAKSGFTIVETVIVVLIVGFLLLAITGEMQKQRVEMPKAFAAWVKQNGNPKELTYEEWLALMRIEARSRHGSSVVLMPVSR